MILYILEIQMVVYLCIFFSFITRLFVSQDLVSISSILLYFRVATIYFKVIFEAGVKLGIKIILTMNVRSIGIKFLVDGMYHDNRACLIYSKITYSWIRERTIPFIWNVLRIFIFNISTNKKLLMLCPTIHHKI